MGLPGKTARGTNGGMDVLELRKGNDGSDVNETGAIEKQIQHVGKH